MMLMLFLGAAGWKKKRKKEDRKSMGDKSKNNRKVRIIRVYIVIPKPRTVSASMGATSPLRVMGLGGKDPAISII